MKNVLHVGCGPLDIKSLPGFFNNGEWEEIRLDIDPQVNPDIVAGLQDLSIIEDAAIEAVYSSHNIEHVWNFEVNQVLAEFNRVLVNNGIAVILCPDIYSVAMAIVEKGIATTLYHSAAGPISALDILYGHGAALEVGRHYMAHKTAFTAASLGQALLDAGFSRVMVARDKSYGLHALAFKGDITAELAEHQANIILPGSEHLMEAMHFSTNEA